MNNILVILEGEKVKKRNVGVKLYFVQKPIYFIDIHERTPLYKFLRRNNANVSIKMCTIFSYKFLKKNYIIYLIQWLKMQILLLSYAMYINVFRK